MNESEKKYGLKEDSDTEKFHQSRHMFAVLGDGVVFAPEDSSLSHADWFKSEGWIDDENEDLMLNGIRGFVDSDGNVYIYTGYNFETNDQLEVDFLVQLRKIFEGGMVRPDAKVFAGMIKQEKPGRWPPKKYLGLVSELVS